MPHKDLAIASSRSDHVLNIKCDGQRHSFTLGSQIGKGGFAVVHQGRRVSDGLRVAIKIRTHLNAKETPDTSDSFEREIEANRALTLGRSKWIASLTHEQRAKYKTIHDLNRSTSILDLDVAPPYICHGLIKYRGQPAIALVTNLCKSNTIMFGNGLRHKDPKQWFGIVCILAHQAISRLEIFHQITGFVHRDFKPPNIVFGLDNRDRYSIQLIDFGCATRWRSKDGRHIEPWSKPIPSGNYYSSPKDRQLNKEYTRKADVEVAATWFWRWGTGKVFPWLQLCRKIKQAENADEILRLTNEIYRCKLDRKSFCGDDNPVYLEFFEECDRLEFADEPNYDRMREIWKNAYVNAGFSLANTPRAFFSHTEVARVEEEYKQRHK